jgi:ABC-type taurine transport system ATPase subunit
LVEDLGEWKDFGIQISPKVYASGEEQLHRAVGNEWEVGVMDPLYAVKGGNEGNVAIVGVAGNFANRPQVLLVDEPFGALDAQTRTIMQEELTEIFLTQRRTVVFITHSVDEVIYLGNRVAVMTARPGKIKKIIRITEEPWSPTGAI